MLRRVALAVPLLLAAGACGGDSDGGAEASGPRPCEPVGVDLEKDATQTVRVVLDEYILDPSEVAVKPGTITFATENVGEEEHELAFLPGGKPVPLLPTGAPDETALETAGAFELEGYGPGQGCKATYRLDPGAYTLFCVITAADGRTHLSKGMTGRLLVE